MPSYIQVLHQIPKTASEKPQDRFLVEALAEQPRRRAHRGALNHTPQIPYGASKCHSDARSSSTAPTATPASWWPSRWRSRQIPFYFAGRSRDKLREGARHRARAARRDAWKLDAEIVAVDNSVETLLPVFSKCSIVINVAGPVHAGGLAGGRGRASRPAATTWTPPASRTGRVAIADKYGAQFAAKGLLLAPATSFMWSAGALAAEVVLEDPEIDSLDILYQVDNGLPSEASTKSFLRMVCNDTSQYYLEQNEYKAWPNDVAHDVFVPYRNAKLRAHPWGGACEPVWLKGRVRNCKVLTAIGEHMIDPIIQAIRAFNAQAPGPRPGRPRGADQCDRRPDQHGRAAQGPPGRAARRDRGPRPEPHQDDESYVMNLSAAYTWTGEISAEAARLILDGQLRKPGFQSVATAF